MTFQNFILHSLSKRSLFKNVYVTFLIVNLKGYTADILPPSNLAHIAPAGNKRKSDKRINLATTNENESELCYFLGGRTSSQSHPIQGK